MDGAGVGAISGHDPANGHFTAGNSERAAKRRRIAERLAQLAADYDPSPSQKQLLAIVAGHLDDAERARSLVQRVKAGNAANRILRGIERKSAPRQPSLGEILRRG